jgi:hypothetical protein
MDFKEILTLSKNRKRKTINLGLIRILGQTKTIKKEYILLFIMITSYLKDGLIYKKVLNGIRLVQKQIFSYNLDLLNNIVFLVIFYTRFKFLTKNLLKKVKAFKLL